MAADYVTLEYTHDILVDDDEPSRYIKALEGYVLVHTGMRRERIGRFKIFVIDVELAINDGSSVFDVFDTYSETYGYWSLYSSPFQFKKKVINAFPEGDRWKPNILILDRMEIFPRHRGKGIGLRSLRCLQREFSTGCGIVAMKPFPLQFEGGLPAPNEESPEFVELALGTFDRNERRATAKLRAYYSRLGFVRVPRTDYMVADPLVSMPLLK